MESKVEKKEDTKITFKKILKGIKYTVYIILMGIAFMLAFHGIKVRVDPNYIPTMLGHTYLNVLSGSMEPDIKINDAVVGAVVNDRTTYQVGDVITYLNGRVLVTHRISKILDDNQFETKGDANEVKDEFPVKKEQIVSKYAFKIPYGGHVISKFQDFTFLAFLWVILMFLIFKEIFLEIRKIKKNKKIEDSIEEIKENIEEKEEICKEEEKEEEKEPEKKVKRKNKKEKKRKK